jgi:uncharacterized protein (TIGR03437 family)
MAKFSIVGFVSLAALLFGTNVVHAQGILGTNLIVNGNAESGSAGTGLATPVTIPGWTVTGKPTVLPYGLTGYLSTNNPAPPDHGFQYFAAQSASTMTQVIDVSSGASAISAGNVKYTAAAYLGSLGTVSYPPQMALAFQNAAGQTFATITLGPVDYPGQEGGLLLQQQIGLVPSGTARITVTVTFTSTGSPSFADSLSIVLTTLGTQPSAVLGTNLVVNPGAEAGPNAPVGKPALYIPGWSTTAEASVAPYGGAGWIQLSDPGPLNRGVNLFCGGPISSSTMYQDIDVSPAASLIDSGQVTYAISAWLGGVGPTSPTLTYLFYDWSGNQLGATAQLGPQSHTGAGLVEVSNSGPFPSGTRRVRITVVFGNDDYAADNIDFTLAAPSGPPVILPGGIVSASSFGGFTSVAPGSWIEIYGSDLASGTQGWAGSDFVNNVGPTSLGGVSVSIGGQPAYIDYVSPGQIDAQVPSGVSTGAVPVTVTNGNGTSDQFFLDVNATAPGLLAPASFVIGGKQYVAALFSDGQTFALPAGAIPGVPSRPASSGDTLTIYGVGFGPVNTGTPAGTIVTSQNALTTPLTLQFGTATATLQYQGLAPSFVGLYLFNVVVPTVSTNSALPLTFTLGGTKGAQTLYIAVQN